MADLDRSGPILADHAELEGRATEPAGGWIDLAREPRSHLGAAEVHPAACEVSAANVRVRLQHRVMQVLVALARAQGEMVSRDSLVESCWGGVAVSDDAINRCIQRLRRLAEYEIPGAFTIETLPRVGYRLNADGDDGQAAPRLRSPRRRLWAFAAALAVVAIAGAAMLIMVREAPLPTRILVASLEPLSDDPEVRSLARQVSREVVDVLGASQTEAVLGGQGQGPPPGVGFVVSGSVRRQDRQIQVKVRLEDAKTHDVLWFKEFDRAGSEIADLRSEVAADLADMARMAVFARASRPPLRDDATLTAFLASQDMMRSAAPGAWASLLTRSQQVVASAPDFSFGHAHLAIAYIVSAEQGAAGARSPALAVARREAERALELDPRDAAGYVALAALAPANDFRAQEAILTRGLQHADRPALAYGALQASEGMLLRDVGRTADALPFLELAVAIDPLRIFKTAELIRTYADLGQQAAANDLVSLARRRWPSDKGEEQYVTGFYGSPQERAALFGGAAADTADTDLPVWRAFYLAGQAPSAMSVAKAARVIIDAHEHGTFSGRVAIMMLARLGLVNEAFDQAARYDWKAGGSWFLFTPPAAAMRKDPRFMPLAARLGLVDYWRTTHHWPDFCQAPDRPYDCGAAAAALGASSVKVTGPTGH